MLRDLKKNENFVLLARNALLPSSVDVNGQQCLVAYGLLEQTLVQSCRKPNTGESAFSSHTQYFWGVKHLENAIEENRVRITREVKVYKTKILKLKSVWERISSLFI